MEKFPHIRDYKAFKLPSTLDATSLLKCQLAVATFGRKMFSFPSSFNVDLFVKVIWAIWIYLGLYNTWLFYCLLLFCLSVQRMGNVAMLLVCNCLVFWMNYSRMMVPLVHIFPNTLCRSTFGLLLLRYIKFHSRFLISCLRLCALLLVFLYLINHIFFFFFCYFCVKIGGARLHL